MSTVNVTVHSSQFPENVTRDLLQSLRTRQINHKFLYDSYRQTRKWLALHRAHSPWRNDPHLATIYDSSFARAAARIHASRLEVVGLGCGDGQKDLRLLNLLHTAGKALSYLAMDVSLALVLTAQKAASDAFGARHSIGGMGQIAGVVCDLVSADDLKTILDQQTPSGAVRLLTFFGMMPNFEPPIVLPRLRTLLRPGDFLLLSANLAPGHDYEAGVRSILPQYDNALTRDWLLSFLFDLGVEPEDGALEICVEGMPDGDNLLRLTAIFRFKQSRVLTIGEEKFPFHPGETIRLFFSYRYTPSRIHALLASHGLTVDEEWIAGSQEEGVFLCTAHS